MKCSVAFLSVGAIVAVQAQLPRAPPNPLPSVTPDNVVNLLFQGLSEENDNNVVASVVEANVIETVFALDCALATTSGTQTIRHSCFAGRDIWSSGVTVTQGPSTMHWSWSGTRDQGVNDVTEACTFNGTTAKTAICTNSLGFGTYFTQDDPFHTLTYDGRLNGDGLIDESSGLFGPPPFLAVSITAGMEKMKAVSATLASSSTSGSPAPSATGSSPTILPTPSGTQSNSAAETSTTKSSSAIAIGASKCLTLTMSGLLVWSSI